MSIVSITMAEVLTLGDMYRCKLIAGTNGLWREVKCVDTMEMPDIYPWLQKNELLMTTGYSIQNDASRVIRLLYYLSDIGGAGLAMTTQFVGRFTPEIIALADNLQMPLIEIPIDVPFIALTNPIMKAIVDEQNKRLRFSEEMNERFIGLEINGGGVQEIADTLSELLSKSVIITDASFCVLAVSGEKLPEGMITQDENDFARLSRACWTRGSGKCYRMGIHYIRWESVMVRNRLCGYVLTLSDSDKENDYRIEALRHAAVSIALEFSKHKSLKDEQQTLNNNLFLDIMMNNAGSEEEMLARANNLRWPRIPIRMTVFDLVCFEKGVRGKNESEIQMLKESISGILDDILYKAHIPHVLAFNSDQFNCLFPADIDLQVMDVLLQSAASQVKQESGFSARIAISQPFHRLSQIPDAHGECRDAIYVSDGHGGVVVHVHDVMSELVFMNASRQSFCEKFARDTVSALSRYDAENNAHLIETVSALFDCAGHKGETAEKLFLHRNTLAYRIRRIEELTGVSLDETRWLMTLGLAAKIIHYLQRKEQE